MRQKIVAGNWKMHKTLDEGLKLVAEIIKDKKFKSADKVLKIIAPPFIHLPIVVSKIKSIKGVGVAAQNCHYQIEGAYTGEVSAKMVASSGAGYVIIGHSERRQYFGETNEILSQKVNMALKEGLIPIFCVGEKIDERNTGKHFNAVKKQLTEALFHLSPVHFKKLILAYEPVWAIGTGVTATSEQAQEMHSFIRKEIENKYGKKTASGISILYGGSCNSKNARELFACTDVDGGLIGGASLNSSEFIKIINSF